MDYRIGHVFAIVASAGRTFFEFWPHVHKSIVGNTREGIFFCLLLGNAQAKSTLILKEKPTCSAGIPAAINLKNMGMGDSLRLKMFKTSSLPQ